MRVNLEPLGELRATNSKLCSQKQQLIGQLGSDPLPHKRDEIERKILELDTALERKHVAAIEGAKAIQEAAQQAIAVRVNMVRLRELRLRRKSQQARHPGSE